MGLGNQYQSFFASISKEQVAAEIAFLRARLPKKSTRYNYQLTPRQLKVKELQGQNLQQRLQAIANRMCEHLNITREIRVVTVESVAAGRFETVGGLACIFINSDLVQQSFRQKVAILAHEMSHYHLMYHHNIVKENERDNELLTEINAVYVGFGFLLETGYMPHETIVSANTRRQTRVGYIPPRTAREAIYQTAYARKQKPHWIVRNISFPYNLVALVRLYQLFSEYYQATKSNGPQSK